VCAIFVGDGSQRVVYTNDRFSEHTGCSRVSSFGVAFFDLPLHGPRPGHGDGDALETTSGDDGAAAALAAMRRCVAAGESWSGEVCTHHSDGFTRMHNTLLLHPVFDNDARRVTHYTVIQLFDTAASSSSAVSSAASSAPPPGVVSSQRGASSPAMRLSDDRATAALLETCATSASTARQVFLGGRQRRRCAEVVTEPMPLAEWLQLVERRQGRREELSSARGEAESASAAAHAAHAAHLHRFVWRVRWGGCGGGGGSGGGGSSGSSGSGESDEPDDVASAVKRMRASAAVAAVAAAAAPSDDMLRLAPETPPQVAPRLYR